MTTDETPRPTLAQAQSINRLLGRATRESEAESQ